MSELKSDKASLKSQSKATAESGCPSSASVRSLSLLVVACTGLRKNEEQVSTILQEINDLKVSV